MKGVRHGVRLEMTPLMDVMFLVLVFFIYCVFEMSVHRGVRVALPDAGGVPERGERIVLAISADGSLQLNGVGVTRDAAIGKVRALAAANVKMPVLISGDRRAELGAGIELLADLKRAGVEQVSFQVQGRRE